MARARTPPRPPLPRFAVVWFPKFRGIEKVEAFRERFDPQARHVAAHLTFVFPFATSHTKLQVRTHVQAVVSRFPPIAVTFRRTRTEANEFVFLMASRGASAIKELHDRLYTKTLRHHLRRDLPYEPHITIGRQPEPAKLELAAAEAEETFGDTYEDVVREVSLLSVGRDGKIGVLESLALDSA